MKSITLTLSGAQLSDLFFNYEHPNRDAVFAHYHNQKGGPPDDELQEAALMDATDFVKAYSVPIESPSLLAEDFLARV